MRHKIIDILKDISNKETISPSDTPETLGLDSLDLVELMLQLEDTFGVRFPNNYLIGNVVDLEREIERLEGGIS